MDYLTKHYKNLCEQRQEQIKLLEQQLIQEGKIMDTIKGVADKVDSVVGGKLSRTFGKVASSVGDFLSSAGKEASAIGRSRHLPTLAADSHRRAILGHFDYPKSWEEFGKEAESMMSELQVRRRANLPTVDDVYRALPKKSFDKKTGRMEDYAAYDAMKEKLTQKAIAEERKHEQSMVLGRLASKISAVSAADIAERKQYEKDHGTGSRFSQNRSEGVTQHHGGHSWHRDSVYETSIPHPEAQSYLDWFNETGRHHEGVPHPDALFGDRSTFHVAEEFEHLLSPQYQKANRKNRAKFDEVVKQAQTIRERIDIPQKAAQDREDLGVALSGGMPAGLRMESKKQLLNNKIKYLLENEKDEGDPTWGDDDVDFGDDDSVDLDAPDEEDMADLNSIRNVEHMIDRGLERIWSASDHPRATAAHKKRLSDIDDRLSGYAEGLKFSKHPDDVAGYHQDVLDALDELEAIHDELGPHGEEHMEESKKQILNNKIKNLMEEPTHLPFEITHVGAPEAYTAPHLYDLDRHDTDTMDSLIEITGRHVRPDGTRGPEVVIHPHAFEGIDRDTILDHAHEMLMYRRRKASNPDHKISEDNILHQTWYGQGGDNPTTINVDPTQVETQEDYNARIREMGL